MISSNFIVADSASLSRVRVGPQASIWPDCALRGDINFIEVSEGSNGGCHGGQSVNLGIFDGAVYSCACASARLSPSSRLVPVIV